MLGDVGGLGLEHQLGNIDMGRTFDAAHLAIDAQIGDGPHLVGRQKLAVSLAWLANTLRSRFALARGAAGSACVARKIGHMRWRGASVRQCPQPLQ